MTAGVQDEMKAMQRINSIGLLLGSVGFMATFILDTIAQLMQKKGAAHAAHATRLTLQIISPHFNLAQ